MTERTRVEVMFDSGVLFVFHFEDDFPVNHAPGAILGSFLHLFQILRRIPVLVAVDFAVTRTTQHRPFFEEERSAFVWLGSYRGPPTEAAAWWAASPIGNGLPLVGTSCESETQRTMMASAVRKFAPGLRWKTAAFGTFFHGVKNE